jgi:hypothetical protein
MKPSSKRPALYPARAAWLKAGNVTSADLRRIWDESGGCCKYCGERVTRSSLYPSTMRGFDHVKPRCAGGAHHPDNLVVCCYACNAAKGEQYPYDPSTPENQARRNRFASVVHPWLCRRGPNKGIPHAVQMLKVSSRTKLVICDIARQLRNRTYTLDGESVGGLV